MSRLIDASGAIPDRFAFVEEAGGLSASGPMLVPLDLLPEALAGRGNAEIGVLVPNRTRIETLASHLDEVSMIAVEFPGFSDGTGLSLAMRLRRAGFAGRLRARGALIADQFAEALACGFDEVELPDASAERQPEAQWLAAKGSITAHYQPGYAGTRSILDERRAAREAAR